MPRLHNDTITSVADRFGGPTPAHGTGRRAGLGAACIVRVSRKSKESATFQRPFNGKPFTTTNFTAKHSRAAC